MTRHESNKMVVDADVALSAGTSDNQMSIDSREFLEALRDSGHQIVWSPDIKREWDKHARTFSLDWFTTMINNDQIHFLGDVQNEDLRNTILEFAPDVHIHNILRKDVHLLEAALVTDKRIASRDKKARRHFCNVCHDIDEIRDVMWVNPDVAEDRCIAWLKRGAPVEAERQLGYQQKER